MVVAILAITIGGVHAQIAFLTTACEDTNSCGHLEGDCDSDADCVDGKCADNVGALFDLAANVDVCIGNIPNPNNSELVAACDAAAVVADPRPCVAICAPAAGCDADRKWMFEILAGEDEDGNPISIPAGSPAATRAVQCFKYDKCGVLQTAEPSVSPTRSPTRSPTPAPSRSPTASPTRAPSRSPTASPTRAPTTSPTASPTRVPSASPTPAPSASPSASPTLHPTKRERTCQELGRDGGASAAFPGVCGVTAVRRCGVPAEQGGGTWAQVRDRCATIGARMCTIAELRNGCASGTARRKDFAEHVHTHWSSEWGHRPAQGPSAPQIGSQRLCSWSS